MSDALDDYLDRLGSQLRSHLDTLTASLVAELGPIVTREPPPGAFLVDFEVRATEVAKPGLPIVGAYFGASRERLEALPRFLAEIPCALPEKVLDVERNRALEVDVFDVAFKELALWLSDCWKRSGGAAVKLPAFASGPDGRTLELATATWVDQDRKWRPRAKESTS